MRSSAIAEIDVEASEMLFHSLLLQRAAISVILSFLSCQTSLRSFLLSAKRSCPQTHCFIGCSFRLFLHY